MTNINTFQGDVFIHEYIKHTGDDNNLFGFSGTDTFKIATAGTDRLTVSSNGSVTLGVNLVIPDYIVHSGDENTKFGFSAADTFIIDTAGTNRLTVGANGDVTFANSLYIADYIYHSGDTNSYFGWQANDTFVLRTNGSEAISVGSDLRMTCRGLIDIPDYIRHIGDTNSYFGFSANDTFVIATSGTTRMKVLSNGLTAIGNHTPTRTLDVNGTCNFRGTAYSPRFTSYYHTTGSISTITNYDISVQGQFLSSVTGSGTNLDTGWYLLSAQRGDGNPFESGSAHFYVHTSGPQRMTTFGQGGISFSTTGQNIRLTSSQNAANYPTPYAIHLCKVGNTYATGI